MYSVKIIQNIGDYEPKVYWSQLGYIFLDVIFECTAIHIFTVHYVSFSTCFECIHSDSTKFVQHFTNLIFGFYGFLLNLYGYFLFTFFVYTPKEYLTIFTFTYFLCTNASSNSFFNG